MAHSWLLTALLVLQVKAASQTPAASRDANGASLAVCVAGEVGVAFQRAMVHRSLRHRLLDGLGAKHVDIFAAVDTANPAEAEATRLLLTKALGARSARVYADGERRAAPRCLADVRSKDFLANIGSPERLVKEWEAVENCFQQILAAEESNGRQYDWLLRVKPDVMWHGRMDPLSTFSPTVVSVAQQGHEMFLCPRVHADVAFRGALARDCDGGSFPVTAHDAGSFFLDVLDTSGVQYVSRAFRGVAVRPTARDAAARRHCEAAVAEGLDEDLCMRLLYGERSEPSVADMLEPVRSDKECTSQASAHFLRRRKVLIATPVKNAVKHLRQYAAALQMLSYPKELLSVALFVSQSEDGTETAVQQLADGPLKKFGDVKVLVEKETKPWAGVDRHAFEVQAARRSALARTRNELLRQALTKDIHAVLWLDVDITSYPANLVQDLFAVGADVVAPHVTILDQTYDRNSWRENRPQEAFDESAFSGVAYEGYGQLQAAGARDHMDVLRSMAQAMGVKPEQRHQYAVRLDGVGTAVLLVDARLHRDAELLFPEKPYKHRVESEGFGLLAGDRGFRVCGLPLYEVRHFNEWAVDRRLQGKGNSTNGTSSPNKPTEKPTNSEPTNSPTTNSPMTNASTTTLAAVTTTVVAQVKLANLSAFDVNAFKAQMAQSLGIDESKVSIASLTFKVAVTYKFTATVTKAQAQAAVAALANVTENAVSVKISTVRRLQQQSGSGNNVDAEITADDAAAAQGLISTVNSTQGLASQLATMGVTTAVEVTNEPAGIIEVETVLISSTGTPIAGPTEAQLSQLATAIGGEINVISVTQTGATGPPAQENAEAGASGHAAVRTVGSWIVALALWATLEGGAF